MTKKEFNEMISRDSRKLFVLAFRMVNNRQEAEDIVQNVFVKLWEMKGELEKVNNPLHLAFKMTRNSCIDILRRWKFCDPNSDNINGERKDLYLSPHEQLVKKEEGGILMKIIMELPSPYKETLIMREIEGLSYQEIAQISDCNINSLRVTVSRARMLVKDKYFAYERR